MSSTSSILQASLGGSLQLIALSGAGAVLSHLGHLTPPISAALSNGVYKLFLPALVLSSILQTTHHALTSPNASLQDVWVPLLASVLIFLITAVITHPFTLFMSQGKEPAVQRLIWVCVVLGNSNTMALLVMESVCDSFDLLRSPTCQIRSTSYASLYIVVVTLFTWTIIFEYLADAPDSTQPELQPLLSSSRHKPSSSFLTLLRRGILSPPSIAVLLGLCVALIPSVPALVIDRHGALHPLLLSIDQIGSVAIPLSSVIVGAELYHGLTDPSDVTDESQTFGLPVMIAIMLVRMVFLPFVGRALHRSFHLAHYLSNPLLSTFVLVEWTVPSANNIIIIVSIVAQKMPLLGKRMREDVSRCLMWQYLALPVLLTLNTELLLRQQFPGA